MGRSMAAAADDVRASEAVTAAERAAGALEPAKLERLLSRWRTHGVAVLEGALPPELDLEPLRTRMDYDAAHQVVAKDGLSAGERGEIFHLQLGLPRTRKYILPDIVANAYVEQFAAAALGPCFMRFFNGNTAAPNSQPQAVHVSA